MRLCAQRTIRVLKLCSLLFEMLLFRQERYAVASNVPDCLVLVCDDAALLYYRPLETRDEHYQLTCPSAIPFGRAFVFGRKRQASGGRGQESIVRQALLRTLYLAVSRSLWYRRCCSGYESCRRASSALAVRLLVRLSGGKGGVNGS